jgi:hypothetical protein
MMTTRCGDAGWVSINLNLGSGLMNVDCYINLLS